MPESGFDNREGILKRLLSNIEAFKRIEKENRALQAALLKKEAYKRDDSSRRLLQEAVNAGKREAQTKKLAKDAIDRLMKANEFLGKELALERKRNAFLSKKYLELSTMAKQLNYDNKLMKAFLMKTNSQKEKVSQRLANITEKLEEKHALVKISYKNLLREHELTKLDTEKNILIEKKKNEFLEKKYTGLVEAFERAKNDYSRTRKMNEALIQKLKILQEKSLANEKVLSARTEMIKVFFENKLKEMAKLQINKEIDYRARIESLSRDMVKYYNELKSSKQKYFTREKEIKEKIKEIFD
jgi:hypothetical protein